MPVIMDVQIVAALVRGKTGGHQADGHAFGVGNVDWFFIEEGALTAGCRKKFARDRVEHHGYERNSIFEQRDGNREAGIAVREIRGAIERVHVPFVTRSGGGAAGAFFGDDAMIWKFAAQTADDDGFGAFIGLSDEIYVAFIGDFLRAAMFGM